jgi:hypothetical protein
LARRSSSKVSPLLRVFHFVNSEFGLENLRRRRLKIATLHELNDPFELFGVSLADEALRHAFRSMKDQVASNRGLLCFSRNWHNPVQWSHYAAKHTGLCLGFDVPDEHLGAVAYSRKRLVVEAEKFRSPRDLDEKIVTRFLFTKYSHWRYENEVRCFVTLEDIDPDKSLYFAEFSDKLRLASVVVGAQSKVTREELRTALGQAGSNVETIKARLAFKTFRLSNSEIQGYGPNPSIERGSSSRLRLLAAAAHVADRGTSPPTILLALGVPALQS